MPALENYDIFLDLTNDMHDPVSIQLLRDYDRQNGRVVLLLPAESLTLILESGSSYQYAVKFRTKVANVTEVVERYKLFRLPVVYRKLDGVLVVDTLLGDQWSASRSPVARSSI